MFQLYELCRLCGQKKKQKLDLFSELSHEETKILLAKISVCLSLQVTKEDLLPKMICTECQKTVEQFNAFRVKCHKAEERLNKILSTLPNKAIVTRIKQEYVEPDSHDITYSHINIDSSKFPETSPNVYLKSVKNVKSEVEESDNNVSWNPLSSDLVQIISEEVANQQILDIKKPQIEVISENFNGDLKTTWGGQNYACDIKVLPEIIFRADQNIIEHNLDFEILNKSDIINIPTEIKQPCSDEEESASHAVSMEKKIKLNKHNLKSKCSIVSNKIDEKYFVLGKDEVCDIDLEEMDALIKKKENPNATFSCDKCNKFFKSFKCLKKHKQRHNLDPVVFICDFCKDENLKCFEFSSMKSLTNHIQRKHSLVNSNKVMCGLCYNLFPSHGQLNAHLKKVHDDSGAVCLTCGKHFKNKSCLNSHAKVHKAERPYVCDQCGQTFKWSNALKVHIMWHKQEKNFLCSECGKKFTAKKNLVEHLNIHTGKRPYVCEDCKASFTQFSAYSKHLYVHNKTKQKMHKCGKCDKTFSHAYLLKQHLIRHTNHRPYECPTCHRTFKSQSDLCCHIKIHQEKQYGCQVCGKKFAVSKTLRDHMVRHTGIKHICPVPGCGKTYTQRFSLTKHFCKQHPSFSIVRKKSGKKALLEKSQENQPDEYFIRYEFEEKEIPCDPFQNG